MLSLIETFYFVLEKSTDDENDSTSKKGGMDASGGKDV
jgi:hypothetical protein